MAEIHINKVGSLGDGMGDLDGQTVFVPRTLAGETVKASGTAPRLELNEILVASPDRVTPPCRHFGTCGGCSLQHMSAARMLEWKHDEVALAFSRAKVKTDIDPCIPSPLHSRRRVTFTARRGKDSIVLGFNERASHDVVDITECPILLPEIESRLGDFRSLTATLLRGNEDIQLAINAGDNGLDLHFTLEQDPSEDMLAAFVRAFARSPFLRAGVNGDVVAEHEKPIVAFGAANVTPPNGGFLQAVVEAESAMADLVCGHLKSRKKVIDLYCGSGTFALRLARNSRVHAVEEEAASIVAIQSAERAEGTKSITTEVRDLEELPLMASELKAYDGLCLDPPRAGAEAQIEEIAKADLRSVAYVSCNPVTLARDTAVLINAGYILERVTPIDQFVFSPHVEVVALFSKRPVKAKRSIFR